MIPFRTFLETSLETHRELNQELWNGDDLRGEVRDKLLAFGRAFVASCHIPFSEVHDYLLVGGSAGYNWTPFSDIDVHALVSRDSLGPRALVDDYLKAKKKNWTLSRRVTVRGYPLEGYVQDPGEKSPRGQGVYSLTRGEWVQRPEHNDHSWSTDASYQEKLDALKAAIDHAVADGSAAELGRIKARLSDMRRAGLASGGEYSVENAVFKSLRNDGYLQRMTDFVRSRQDADLSLPK